MKNLVVVIVLVGIAAALYFYVWPALQGRWSTMGAEDRVVQWLEAQKARDSQSALCLWAVGKPMMSMQEMRAYTDRYDDFRREAGMFEEVESYTIDSVSPPDVTVTVNGRRLVLRVEEGRPISLFE